MHAGGADGKLGFFAVVQVHRVYVRLAQNESTLARMRPKRNVTSYIYGLGGFGHVHIDAHYSIMTGSGVLHKCKHDLYCDGCIKHLANGNDR